MRKLILGDYQDTGWADDIECSDEMRIGFYRVGWEVSGGDILASSTSALDLQSATPALYKMDIPASAGGGLTSSDYYVYFDASNLLLKTLTDIFTGSWDAEKNGYYYGSTRIVGFYDGSESETFPIGSKDGRQI